VLRHDEKNLVFGHHPKELLFAHSQAVSLWFILIPGIYEMVFHADLYHGVFQQNTD
jgi:hypothetical protein